MNTSCDFPKTLPDMTVACKTNVLRIVQEALINIRKHAGATTVAVRLESLGSEGLEVAIIDNGVGFDLEDVSRTVVGHYGLLTIQERARLVGGELTITSRPGQGTAIRGKFPAGAHGYAATGSDAGEVAPRAGLEPAT